MPKIYLLYSLKTYGLYGGESVSTLCRRYTEMLASYLGEGGIEAKIGGGRTVSQRIHEVMRWRPDICYTAAAAPDGQCGGSALYLFPVSGTLETECAAEISRLRSIIYGVPVSIRRSRYIAGLHPCGIPCIYDGLVCLTDPDGAASFRENSEYLAESTAAAFCRCLTGCGKSVSRTVYSFPDDRLPAEANQPKEDFASDGTPENMSDAARLLPEAEEEMISHIGPFPEDGGVYLSILP